jgi:hypothetical protein
MKFNTLLEKVKNARVKSWKARELFGIEDINSKRKSVGGETSMHRGMEGFDKISITLSTFQKRDTK